MTQDDKKQIVKGRVKFYRPVLGKIDEDLLIALGQDIIEDYIKSCEEDKSKDYELFTLKSSKPDFESQNQVGPNDVQVNLVSKDNQEVSQVLVSRNEVQYNSDETYLLKNQK